MADSETRQSAVEANIEAIKAKYGDDAYDKINSQCLEDISVSLAMLVDAGTSST